MGEVQDWNTLEGFVFGDSETAPEQHVRGEAAVAGEIGPVTSTPVVQERFRLVEILGEGADR
ncbi:hypothetical protein [Phenylobacterium sp.]|uniref:hypothetical protein n=1 Tax=Phenylobacterium sp. TaxID=1871053 RepID=UPI003982FA11